MQNGMAFLTEDRKETGCFLLLDIQENTQMAVLQNRYVKYGFIQQKALAKDSKAIANTCGCARRTCRSRSSICPAATSRKC